MILSPISVLDASVDQDVGVFILSLVYRNVVVSEGGLRYEVSLSGAIVSVSILAL